MIALAAVVVATGALMGGWLWFRQWAAQQRVRAIAAVAAANGWSFEQTDTFDCEHKPFHLFERGNHRSASNVCSIQAADGSIIRLYDYTFTDDNGHSGQTYDHSCYLFEGRDGFPLLTIERETRLAGALKAIGAGDLQFESEEFNREFHVTSEDPRFASALIDAGMMEFLQGDFGATMHISIHERYVLIWTQRIVAKNLPSLFQYGEHFRALIPAVVRELYPGQ